MCCLRCGYTYIDKLKSSDIMGLVFPNPSNLNLKMKVINYFQNCNVVHIIFLLFLPISSTTDGKCKGVSIHLNSEENSCINPQALLASQENNRYLCPS